VPRSADRLTPRERALQNRYAALKRWSKEDPRAGTEAARAAAEARFYEGIPEDLPAAERDRRAVAARKAHFTKLALESAKSRRRTKQAS
jgi:hypothetical protein